MCCQTNAGDFYLRVTHWSPPIPPRGGFSDKWTRVKTLSLEKSGHGDCCQLEARTQGLLEYHWRCNEIFTAQVIMNEITYATKYIKKIGINKLLNDWQLNLLLWANTYMHWHIIARAQELFNDNDSNNVHQQGLNSTGTKWNRPKIEKNTSLASK